MRGLSTDRSACASRSTSDILFASYPEYRRMHRSRERAFCSNSADLRPCPSRLTAEQPTRGKVDVRSANPNITTRTEGKPAMRLSGSVFKRVNFVGSRENWRQGGEAVARCVATAQAERTRARSSPCVFRSSRPGETFLRFGASVMRNGGPVMVQHGSSGAHSSARWEAQQHSRRP
jgi:hypothetical protein